MATYQLVAATGSFDPATGLTTFTNRPANAMGLGTLDANSQVVPTPQAALSLPSTDTARDPLAVGDVLSITKAVTDPSNTWVNGDLVAYGTPALQDAGAPAAVSGQHSSILVGSADVVTLDEFDYPDAGGAGAWRCRYSRRTDGTSGWTRIPKG